jgi:YfiH family protein
MRLPEPFSPLGQHFAIELPGARALFTTRRGGHSRGPYASLNLGRLTDDEPRAVARNRRTLEEDVSATLTFVRQVHGNTVHHVTAAGTEPAPAGGVQPLPEADGQVTSAPGLALAALTADCLPIAVSGPGAVAMLHAGWRGLAAGIIGAGVRELRRLGARGRLSAAIGPGAGPCCYAVGAEVHARFAAAPAAVHREGKLDLKAIAGRQLREAGVAQVYDIGLCTICSDPALLFSHRRDRGVTGRQAGVAWLS